MSEYPLIVLCIQVYVTECYLHMFVVMIIFPSLVPTVFITERNTFSIATTLSSVATTP
jgi:hypothetical protein